MREERWREHIRKCATLIQKRWRGTNCRLTHLVKAKRVAKSQKLLRAILKGFKLRKIWACKEVVSFIVTIKDM